MRGGADATTSRTRVAGSLIFLLALFVPLLAACDGFGAAGGVSGGTESPPPKLGTGVISQLRLTWSDNPATSVDISWTTRREQASVVWVDEDGLWRRFPALATPRDASDDDPLAHRVTITALAPGRTYQYVVSGDGGTSKPASFRTAPEVPSTFRFSAFADQGDCETYPAACRVIRNIAADRPAFVIGAGDLSYANMNGLRAWDRWLQDISAWATSAPIVPSVGNHEWQESGDTIKSYKSRFALPGLHNEDYYSFDYGGVHFVALPEPYVRTGQGSPFGQWLVSDLTQARANPAIHWIVAFDHRPLYTTGTRHGPSKQLARDIAPVLDRFHVDLMISGHEHVYERTLPIRGGKAAGRESRRIPAGLGTVYVVTGGGGAPIDGGFGPAANWDVKRAVVHEHVRVDVTPESLRLVSVESRGQVIDDFMIVR